MSSSQTGNVIKSRAGQYYVVMLNVHHHESSDILVNLGSKTYIDLCDYRENMLTNVTTPAYCDIMEVYSVKYIRDAFGIDNMDKFIKGLEIIWQREETELVSYEVTKEQKIEIDKLLKKHECDEEYNTSF